MYDKSSPYYHAFVGLGVIKEEEEKDEFSLKEKLKSVQEKLGSVKEALTPKHSRPERTVIVHSGKIYLSTDDNGLSDPYVRLGRLRSEDINDIKWLYTSPVEKETLTPNWRARSSIRIQPDEYLVVEVKDKDLFIDDFVGRSYVKVPERGEKYLEINCFGKTNGVLDDQKVTAMIEIRFY